MFKSGQRIVCINDQFDPLQQASIPHLPKEKEVYTVRDAFQVTRNGTVSGVWAVHLQEISNPLLEHPSGMGKFEPSFAASRFALSADDQEATDRMLDAMVRELEKEHQLEIIG